jgi:phosphoacetylglucosamine mutase
MMELEDKDLLRKQAALFPLPKGVKFSYGTAGFRTDAALLPSTVFRMGVLAALRSLCTKRATGLMITASHNPVHENGVKLADPSGGMLNVAWEPYSDMLANAPDVENFLQIVEHIVKRENIQYGNAASGEVLLARDTRPSGEALVSAARQVSIHCQCFPFRGGAKMNRQLICSPSALSNQHPCALAILCTITHDLKCMIVCQSFLMAGSFL